jgi:hypothetical protein
VTRTITIAVFPMHTPPIAVDVTLKTQADTAADQKLIFADKKCNRIKLGPKGAQAFGASNDTSINSVIKERFECSVNPTLEYMLRPHIKQAGLASFPAKGKLYADVDCTMELTANNNVVCDGRVEFVCVPDETLCRVVSLDSINSHRHSRVSSSGSKGMPGRRRPDLRGALRVLPRALW